MRKSVDSCAINTTSTSYLLRVPTTNEMMTTVNLRIGSYSGPSIIFPVNWLGPSEHGTVHATLAVHATLSCHAALSGRETPFTTLDASIDAE